MFDKPYEKCAGCPLLHLGGESYVPPYGAPVHGVALVGDAPNQREVERGEPFVSREGQVLGRTLRVGGLHKSDYLILNALQCTPPDLNPMKNTTFHGALGCCSKHRDPLLNNPDIHTIITFGETPFKLLTGQRDHQKKRGYVYTSEIYPNKKIIGTYHPAYVGRGKMALIQALLFDIKAGPKKPWPVPTELLFLDEHLHTTPAVLEAFVDEAIALAEYGICDIETNYSLTDPEDAEVDDVSYQIVRVSIGYIDRRTQQVKALTFPWDATFLPGLKRFLASGLDMIFWNGDYDVPRLEYNGCPLTGRLIDAMWLFHFLFPDLPRGLGSVASFYTDLAEWKSLSSSSPALYSAIDSLATGQAFLGIRNHLKQYGMWEAAQNEVIRLKVVLRKMETRGLLVDLKALQAFNEDLDRRLCSLQTTINVDIPQSVRPTKMITAKHLRGRCSCLRPKLGKKGQPLKSMLPNPSCSNCGGTGWLPPIQTILDFNCNATEQVKALIRSLGHKVPTKKDKSGEVKETTDKKELDFLAAQYPDAPYAVIREYRQIAKMRNTYGNWPLRESKTRPVDPALYREAATKLNLDPASGRLNSVNPNMQNIPKEGELADAFKQTIVATPGHIIVKRDYSGIEAVLTGYFSVDNDYLRLARLGVHTYRCAQYHEESPSLDLSDEDLKGALKQLKKKYDTLKEGERTSIYQKFKKINHMSNYKAGPKKIFDSSPGVFTDLSEAKKLHRFIYAQAPKLAAWHKNIEARGRKEYRIVTPYMNNRWFWDLPSDITKAVAQEPQSTAASIIKEAMLLVDGDPALSQYMVLQVHDELVFDFPIGPGSCPCHPDNKYTWQELDEMVRLIMERPLLKLGNLVILTEGTHGSTYASH